MYPTSKVRKLSNFKRLETQLDIRREPIDLTAELAKGREIKAFVLDLIQQYIAHLRETKRKESTIDTFIRLERLFSTFDGRFRELDDKFVEKFSQHLIIGRGERRNSNSTIRAHFERLQTVLNFYKIEHSVSLANFRQFNRKPFHEVKDEIFTDEEIRLLWAYKPRNRYEEIRLDMTLISLHTGCRKSELPTLFTSKEKDQTVIGYYSTKDGEARFIPMYPPLKPVIDRNQFRRKDINVSGKPYWSLLEQVGIKGEGIQIKRFGNEVERIMIPRNHVVTFHSCRKTFAVKMLEAGVDVFTVSKLLGHSDVATTLQYYAYISEAKIHERVNEAFKLWQAKF